MPMNISLGNKKPAGPKSGNPLGQKRKNIFDDDSGAEDEQNKSGAVEVSTIGGLEEPAPKAPTSAGPPPKRKMQFRGAAKPAIKPLSKNSLFADDEDEDEAKEKEQQGQMHLGLNQAKSKNSAAPGKDFTNLSAMHSSKKHAKEAEELDPSIYSYDAVYDSLHAKPTKSSVNTKSETPKYMQNLLQSAEIRKRDQLRAKDRQLAREREAEGDEFDDKEKFVTSAYKAQQEELRRAEEEEARREQAEEERRKKSGNSGMIGFYRDVLSRGEEQHEQAVKAAEEAARRVKEGELPEETKDENEKTEAEKAEDLNSRGARVAVNDEGQVVDKRQLLSAGLNVAPKPKSQAPAPKPAARPAARPVAGHQNARAAQRARQTDMVASQYEERARQEEEAEAAKQKEIAEKSRSRKTEGEVSSAKERYLARKKEREEAAAKAKGA
ncbi:unnamed protein product [Penicillium olsonii]|uniref:Nuclear speckle splicing regulatory protein 1 N-terminal domain-containing protein n=1 Tax=Penicillium olsonii TaxID=99116 RepID=A0A9W4MHN9_PENOL|nr:unnamed protein product [Penicillium olsonii]CAG8271784.1 unnamed protein product [Penicillium olsonii]